MATIALDRLKHVGYIGSKGGPPAIEQVQEADSQTFLAGALVRYDGSGALIAVAGGDLVTAGTADTLDIRDFAVDGAPKILGVALAPGTNVTADHATIPVAVLSQGAILEGNWTDATDGTTILAEVLAAGDIGARAQIILADTGFWHITEGDAGEEVGTVIRAVGSVGDARTGGGVGDTNPRVLLVWSPLAQLTDF
jgi:hypothetical protein